MKCFHHNDMDGHCAAHWVLALAKTTDDRPKTLISCDFKNPVSIELVEPGEQVYIVDYGLKPDQIKELQKITSDITWIDHHKTAIDAYAKAGLDLRGIRYDGVAACVLTHLYLNTLTDGGLGDIKPVEDINRLVQATVPYHTRLVGDRDVWAFCYGDDTKYLHAGLQTLDTQPKSPIWGRLHEDEQFFREVLVRGQITEEYKKQQRQLLIKNFAFKRKFEGYNAVIINAIGSREMFDVLEDAFDLFISCIFDGKKYHLTLYSDTIDVSKLAVRYGGGGHKGAAGFQAAQLPF